LKLVIMTKPQTHLSVREQKAEALDTLVKAELARTKSLNAAKIAKLKALRLARDEQEANAAPPHPPVPPRDIAKRRRFM
jgi:hypothetical protein